MHSIPIRHTHGSYDYLIGPGLSAEAGARVTSLLAGRRIVVITDAAIRSALTATGCWPAIVGDVIEAPAGEGAKSRAEWQRITDRLLALGVGRDAVIVAVGGGSIGDLAGFVAATYLRGVPFVQIPTTLLAMVDASVGGKVGVDTPAGKNLVGAFHPPALVLTDPRFLASLPDQLFREGLAEAVKHGVIADRGYFDFIASNAEAIGRREGKLLKELIHRSVEIKAGIVTRDEQETGERAALNAGHTVAHALELLSSYTLRHGDAVAIGLVAECRIGEALGVTAKGAADSVAATMTALGLPTAPDSRPSTLDLLSSMRTDKKNRNGTIRMAIPASVGTMARDGGSWTIAVPENLITLG